MAIPTIQHSLPPSNERSRCVASSAAAPSASADHRTQHKLCRQRNEHKRDSVRAKCWASWEGNEATWKNKVEIIKYPVSESEWDSHWAEEKKRKQTHTITSMEWKRTPRERRETIKQQIKWKIRIKKKSSNGWEYREKILLFLTGEILGFVQLYAQESVTNAVGLCHSIFIFNCVIRRSSLHHASIFWPTARPMTLVYANSISINVWPFACCTRSNGFEQFNRSNLFCDRTASAFWHERHGT